MGFLSGLIPGVRHVRTPFINGTLWLSIFYVFGVEFDHQRLRDSRFVTDIQGLIGSWPMSYKFALLGFAAYLLGAVMEDVSGWFSARTARRCRKVADWIGSKGRYDGNWIQRPLNRFRYRIDSYLASSPPSVRGPIIDAVASAYGRIGARSSAHFTFPVEAVTEKIETLAMQLSRSAPDQYQEYDRLSSEVELRRAIVPPLLVIGGLATWDGPWWALPLSVVVAGVLIRQAFIAERRARELVANSIYLGTVEVPVLNAVIGRIESLHLSAAESQGTWVGATTVALWQVSEYEFAEDAAHEAVLSDGAPSQVVDDMLDFVALHETELGDALEARYERLSPLY